MFARINRPAVAKNLLHAFADCEVTLGIDSCGTP
jgi:hypothetical protein